MIRIILPIIILILGGVAMGGLMTSADTEKRTDPPPVEMRVNVQTVQSSSQVSKVYSSGVVSPAQEVNIIPQVSGKIVSIADGLQSGRRFEKGDVIARIDRKDYKLVIQQEKARVEQAELNLKLEQERLQAAQREWELLGNEGEAPDLASRKPQLALAKLNVESAQASLERAELSLSRTKIRAPFNSIVKMEQLEVGQVVGQGVVATLLGTDQYWIRVSIPASRLADIDIPDVNAEEGSTVSVLYSPSASVQIEKKGTVLRLESELDPRARTATILIGVDNPLEGDKLPLMSGAYVDVCIHGKSVEQAYRIPSIAIKEGKHVLIADSEGKLAKKDVELGWTDGEESVVLSGLATGDKIITTAISYPIYGTPLTINEEK